MPLETLQPGAQVNIHDLTLEAPHFHEPKFEPGRDISQRDRLMLENLALGVTFPPTAFDTVSAYLELFPERVAVFQADPRFGNFIMDPHTYRLSRGEVRRLKALQPKSTREDITSTWHVDAADIEVAEVVSRFEVGVSVDDLKSANDLKILSPQDFEPVTFTSEAIGNARTAFEVHQQRLLAKPGDLKKLSAREAHEYILACSTLADLGANIKILFGKQLNLVISSETWARLQDLLDHYRELLDDQWNYHQFLYLARNLAVLSADEITVDDEGIHKIYHSKQDFQTQLPPLPEARRF